MHPPESPSDRLRRLVRLPARASRIRADVDAELAHHLEATERELMAAGMTADAARREARRRFGDVEAVRHELGAIDRAGEGRRQRGDFWRGWRQDLARSARSLRREPSFVAVVALTLALGLGGNATMFRVIDRLLLRPAPHVRDDGSLSLLYFQRETPEFGRVTGTSQSYPVFDHMRRRLAPSTELAAWWSAGATSGRGLEAQSLELSYVTPNFFDVLGVRPWRGRVFGEADWKGGGQSGVVVTHALALARFGSAEGAIGQTIALDDADRVIVGVTPPGFTGPLLRRVDAFVTMQEGVARQMGEDWARNKNMRWLQMVVRRAPGVSAEEAGAAATRAVREAGRTLAKDDSTTTVIAGSIIPGRRPDGSANAQLAIWLGGVTLLVLVVACANVANLMLARTVRRRRELAVHLALGISRARITRLLLTEALMLGAIAGALALVLSMWGEGALRATLLRDMAWDGGAIDARSASVVALLAVLAAALAGAVPAAVAARTPLVESLKAGVRDGGARRGVLRRALVVVQGTLSVVLLIGAGLFVRSFERAASIDLGYRPAGVYVASPDLSAVARSAEESEARWAALERTIGALPGVRGVAQTVTVPFESQWVKGLLVNGDTLPPVAGGGPYVNAVSPGYFAALGTPVLRGRAFTAQDRQGAPPVAVVNQRMATLLWPGREAVGQCLTLELDAPCLDVVGVVADHRIERLAGAAPPHFFQPVGQWSPQMRSLLVQVAADGGVDADAIRRAVAGAEPGLPYIRVQALSAIVDEQLHPWRLGATMFALFGVLGLVVAALGLYSVVAHDVAQRSHEIGVRLALGARRADVARLVVGRGVVQALVGVGVGLVLAALVTRRFADLLFEPSPSDPVIYGGVGALLLVVAVVATLVPARRAARVEPVEALREG